MNVLLVHSGNAVKDSTEYTFVKDQGDALSEKGIDVFYYAVHGKGVKGYLSNFKVLKKTIHDNQIDIVHAHYGLCGALAVMQRKVPVVITFHNGETLTIKGKIISSIASHLSSYNVFVAEHIRRKLFCPRHRFSIIPCGVWLDKLPMVPKEEALSALGLNSSISNILFGGAFSNLRKNVVLAREAIDLVDFPVNLIEMKGWSREQVPYLLSACDMLLLPTLSEGSPQVVKEALACNCPIVATDVADIAWLLDGVSNSCVTSFDAQQIADSISRVLATGKRSGGRDRVVELGLDNPIVAQKLFDIYNQVLEKHHK